MSTIGGPLPGEEDEQNLDGEAIKAALLGAPKKTLDVGLQGLQKWGEAIDWTNDQVSVRNMTPIGRGLGQIADRTPTKWDDKILNYSYKDLRDHTAGGIGNVAGWTAERFGASKERAEQINAGFELGGQILLPDAVDFIGGVGYADNIAKGVSKLSDTKVLKKVDYNQVLNSVFNPKRFSDGFKKLQEDAVTAVTAPVRTIRGAFEGIDAGTGGAKAMRGDGVPQLARMYFSRSGLRGGVFDLETWRKAGSDRNVMELFQTRWDQVAYRNMPHKQFISTRQRLIEPFLKEYASYIKKFNINPSTIELHHIFGLNLSAPLYDGLRYASKEWDEMTTLLNKTGLFPGAPATGVAKKSNLMLALQEPHDLLHNQFFKNTIGVKGEKFFTPERMTILHSSPAGRLQIAKEYSEHVKKGEVLIKRAMDQIQATFGASNISPEKLADAFSQSLADGTTNIFKEGYKIESVNKVIKNMVFDIQLDAMVDPLKKRAFKNVSELKQEILLDRAAGMSNKELRKKYGKSFDIKQLDLFDQ